jgi:hypothetical protein
MKHVREELAGAAKRDAACPRRRGDRVKRRDTGPLTVVWILLTASAAFAAEPMAPSDIQATFFNGQPFTASTPAAPNSE